MGSKNKKVGDDSGSLVDGGSKANELGMKFSNQEGAMQEKPVKNNARKSETFSEPQNPAIDRLQSALKAQLIKTRDRIQRELREDQDGLRQVKKDREDCGVELYGMQQQLALLQKKVDETEEKHTNYIHDRQRIEEKLIGLRDKFKSQIAKKHDLVKKVSKRKDDLDAAESSLRQAQKFNQEAKKEVAITKRAASKAEETVNGAEKSKEAQDLYINEMNRQIRNLETELVLVAEELILHKKQTQESDAMIKDMLLELEGLSSEKKRLVQQWNSAIMALGRRDQALTAAATAVKKAQNAAKDSASELMGLKRDYFNLSAEKEKRQFDRSRIKNEIKFLDENVQKARSEQEMLASQIGLIFKIMTKTQEDCLLEERAAKRHKSSDAVLVHKIEGISSERRVLEERLGGYKEEQAAISQAAMIIVKQEHTIASKIHGKEIDVGAIENEVARVKIDTMNTSVHCSQLMDRLNDEVEDLNKKDTAVAKLQAEMRRSNDGIESKMNKVDRLNRKYEQMVGGVDDEEPLGPLEASIKSLEKDLEEMEGNSKSFQDKWISSQAKLIKTIEKTETFEEENLQKSAMLTILKQKRLRLLQDIHTNKASLREIEGRTKSMHTDMSRLNELIGVHSQMRAKLVNEKGLDKIELSEEIKEIQDKVLKIEAKRVNAQSAKAQLLQQIMDIEKEILGWEKKIQLEKETQVALNSSEHAIEIKGMEKEIHRMRHRLEDMNRHKEKMIRDMELAIYKREDIAVKYQHTKQGQRHGPSPQTVADVRNVLGDLKGHMKRNGIEKETLLSNQGIQKMKIDALETTVDAAKKDMDFESDRIQSLQRELNSLLFEKQRSLMKSTRLTELLTMYRALNIEPPKDQFVVQKRVSVIDAKISRIKNAIAGLRIQHGQYDEVFERVIILTNDVSHISER